MENQLWKARWKKVRHQYWVSLVDYPKIKGKGSVLDEAIENLEDEICDKLRDAVPHLEFINSLPERDLGGDIRSVHVLVGHERVRIEGVERLFAKPQCKKCGGFRGRRVDVLLQLEEFPKGDITFTEHSGDVISKRLSGFLELGKCREIRLLPVTLFGKPTGDFFELYSVKPREFVAKLGTRSRWAYRCSACGLENAIYMPDEAPFARFVSADCIPKRETDVFPIGVAHKMELAVSAALRNKVIRSKDFKNVVSRKTGVLPKKYVAPLHSLFAEKGT